MSSVNNALGSSGAGFPITWRGKQYTMMPLRDHDKGRLESILKARVWADVRSSKEYLEPEEYGVLVQATREQLTDGEYDFDSPAFQRFFDSNNGKLEFVRCLLTKHHPEMTESDLIELLKEEGEQVMQGLMTLHPDLVKKKQTETEKKEITGP